MAKLKLLSSAALLAAVVFAAPAMAREHHAARHSTNNAYVSSDPADAYAAAPDAVYPAYGYRCVPAPRVGQFAGGPWTNDVACEPAYGFGY
jgi:hypothetical protein